MSAKRYRKMLQFGFFFLGFFLAKGSVRRLENRSGWKDKLSPPTEVFLSNKEARSTPHSNNSYWMKNHLNNFEFWAQSLSKTLGETDRR